MRTTVDIPDSLDRQIRERADELGLSYKEALNRALTVGLPSLCREGIPFSVTPRACGWKPGYDSLHLNRLSDELEDEEKVSHWSSRT